jgi:omega-6 fatty acid desaturase (delta-12 desaturase)
MNYRLAILRRTCYPGRCRNSIRRAWRTFYLEDPLSHANPPVLDQRTLRKLIAAYARPHSKRAAVELLVTALPFFALMAALFVALDHGWWAALLLSIPAGALLVRLFMIQHDCGHGAFFRSRRLNDIVGRVIGVLTMTPYAFWRRCHAVHHAGSGNLDRRGIGDVRTMTVREYLSASSRERLFYRLYRHPLVLFGIGPGWLFLVRHRIPTASMMREREAWISVLGTNAALLGMGAVLAATLGWATFLMGYLPVALLGATAGVWLFYVQHQFEDTYWAHEPQWDFATAAVSGSSYYDLPGLLRWVTANIGFHHLHHLSSKIPSYRLRDCFRSNPEFRKANRLTLWSSLRAARLALWDEDTRKLVSFRQVRGRIAAA